MKGFITLFMGLVSPLFFCSDLWAQFPQGSYIIRGPSMQQGRVCPPSCVPSASPPNTGGWRASQPRIISPPRAQRPQSRGELQPLPPPSLLPLPSEPPLDLPLVPVAPLDPPPVLPGPGPACKYNPEIETTLSEILAAGRQNSTKLNQLLEYAKVGPTADQLRQEHQRIEQLIAGTVTRLEAQHKRIEQEIRELHSRDTGDGDQGGQGGASAEALAALNVQISNLSGQLAAASATPVTAEPSEAMQASLDGIIQRLDALTTKVDRLVAQGPGEVNLTVDTPTFLSPDYVDLSLIWAQQKATGIHHAVLVADTRAESWSQLGQAYTAARAKFAPLSLFDVRSKNVVVKKLPQLVVYRKEGEPSVLSSPEQVVEELSRLARLP